MSGRSLKYEQQGLFFKGGIPVTDTTIQERIGVRTRKVASADERIGVTAFQDLLDNPDFDPLCPSGSERGSFSR